MPAEPKMFYAVPILIPAGLTSGAAKLPCEQFPNMTLLWICLN